MSLQEAYEVVEGEYISVKLLGGGAQGKLFFAFPSNVAFEYPIPKLRKHLCVLKVWKRSEVVTNEQPQKALRVAKRVEQSREVPFSFSSVLESYEAPSGGYVRKFNWQATTFLPGLNLGDLTKAVKKWPENESQALSAHIAIQLYDAVQWLHSQNPPIYHMDMHLRNVILLTPRSSTEKPRLVLVDFEIPDNYYLYQDRTTKDRINFFGNIYLWSMAAAHCHDFHSGSSKEAHKCKHHPLMSEMLTAIAPRDNELISEPREEKTLQGWHDRFYDSLKAFRDETWPKERELVHNLFRRAINGGFGPELTDEDIENGLDLFDE
jgi:serine/threonine protein kinase